MKDRPARALSNLKYTAEQQEIERPQEEVKEGNEEEKKEDADKKHDMLANNNPVWGSRTQRKRDNKEKAKEQGKDKYRGGGYMVDKRWAKEEEDADGNLERIGFLKKLKLASFDPLDKMNKEER